MAYKVKHIYSLDGSEHEADVQEALHGIEENAEIYSVQHSASITAAKGDYSRIEKELFSTVIVYRLYEED